MYTFWINPKANLKVSEKLCVDPNNGENYPLKVSKFCLNDWISCKLNS